MTHIFSMVWLAGWLDYLSALVKTVIEVAEAFGTVLYLLGKLLGA